MARIVFQYLNDPSIRDAEEEAPIPNVGDVLNRKGKEWVVDSVTGINTHTASGSSTKYVVNLMPPGNP